MRGHASPLFVIEISLKTIVEQIEAKVLECIQDQAEIFLVDVISKGKGDGGKVIVLLDGDQGITIDQCVEISRELSRYVDEELELTQPLTLEVSSPGLDHPLKLKRQYVKNTGKSVRVSLLDQSEAKGTIIAVDDDKITLRTEGSKKKPSEEIEIEFKNINKTIVLVSFK